MKQPKGAELDALAGLMMLRLVRSISPAAATTELQKCAFRGYDVAAVLVSSAWLVLEGFVA